MLFSLFFNYLIFVPRVKQSARKRTLRYSTGSSNLVNLDLEMGRSHEDVVTTIDDDELERIRSWAGFSPSVKLIAPSKSESPKLFPLYRVVFFEYLFRLGYKFPFSELIQSVLKVFNLSPGQMLHSFCRICSVIEENTQNWDAPFSLD